MPFSLDSLRAALSPRYDVEREVGRGGMAIVFLARDLKHDRKVALKVLRPEIAGSVGPDRFLREIRIAAGLSHPNILPLFDSGEAAGLLYYVMPYVEGESLRQRLEREKQLPINEAVEIVAQVAEALDYAHGQGVVHRDIKPGNILFEAGRPVVTDFGVARAVTEAGEERLTGSGVAVGTVAYMSPEQASGDEHLDRRSDIYALGCVLYEMLAGEPPFAGRTPQAIMARRMTDTLPPLRAMRDTIPANVERAVSKALSKTPADRYATGAQFAGALRAARESSRGESASPLFIRSSGLTLAGHFIAYLIASLLVFQLAVTLTDRFALPAPFLNSAIFLILLGLVLFTLTALVQGRYENAHEPGDAAVSGRSQRTQVRSRLRSRLTWARSLGGILVMISLWGLVTAGWVLVGGEESTGVASTQPAASEGFDPTRIAVLYFDDFSDEGELDYLANGLTEAVIHELSQVDALRVISRNGVRQYRDAPVSLDSISRALEVGTVIEGSVARSGDRLRVTAQIIETKSMTHLASLVSDRAWADWLALIDDIVGDIAREFRGRLGIEIRVRERAAGSSDPRAWALVQRAEKLRQEHHPLMMAGDVPAAERALLRADSLLAQAEELDRSWQEPVVLRGWVAADMADLLVPTAGGHDPKWIERGLGFADWALARDRADPHGLELRGTLRYRAWQASDSADSQLLATAEEDLRDAVLSDPSRAGAWATLSELLHEAKGEFREAKLAAQTAYEQDAFLTNAREILFRLSNTSLEIEEFDDAIYWAEEGRRRFSQAVEFPALELAVLSEGGPADVARAWNLVEAIERLSSPRTRALYGAIARIQVTATLARAGLADSARSVLRRVRAQAPADPQAYLAYDEAHARLLLGEREEALRALAKYLEVNPQEKSYIAEDRWFRELHSDPRFEELVRPNL